MRIVIETNEGEKPSQAEPTTGAEDIEQTAPPSDIAAHAAALGAASAGPAPADAAAEAPATFVGEPGVPETAPDYPRATPGSSSAGAAPGFATGAVEAQEVPADAEAAGEAEA